MDRADLEQWKGREVARLLALVETERRYYQEIVAAVPVGLAVISPERDIISANRAFRQAFALRADELRRRTLDQLIPSADLQRAIALATQSGAPQPNLLLEIASETGTPRRIRAAVTSIRNWDDETQLEALLMIEDVSDVENLRAGAPLIITEPTPEQPAPGPVETVVAAPPMPSFSEAPAVVWIANPETLEFRFVDGAVEETLGYPASHWTDTVGFFADRIHAGDRDDVVAFYRRAIETGRPGASEFRAVTADGQIVWCRESFRLRLDTEGKPARLIGALTDITERRQAEEQVIQSNRMDALTTFSKSLTHELNNPLMIVNGYGEELLASLDETDPRRNEMEEILHAGERIANITNQLLTFTRKQGATPAPFHLGAALEALRPRLDELGGPLTWIAPTQSVWAIADRAQTEAAVLALAARLRRHAGDQSSIAIAWGMSNVTERLGRDAQELAPGEYAEVALSAETAVEQRGTSFESLVSAKDPTGPELARAYAIVREWGGCIWQTQTPEGAPAFHVFLPAATPPVEEPEPEPEPVPEPEPAPEPEPEMETILVVEDEGGIRALVRKILRRQGYHVLEAGAPSEAVEVSRNHAGPIHLLVTDMTLPERSGRELSEELIGLFPDLRVLYVSGYTDDASVYAADLPAGAAFLQKPFTLGSLLKKVREILDTAK